MPAPPGPRSNPRRARTGAEAHDADRTQRRAYLVAEPLAQNAPQIADAIGEAEADRGLRSPKFSREQQRVLALEAAGTPFLHQRDEMRVDILLDGLQALDVFRLFRLEGIEHHLALARGVDAALDAELLHQLGKAEG